MVLGTFVLFLSEEVETFIPRFCIKTFLKLDVPFLPIVHISIWRQHNYLLCYLYLLLVVNYPRTMHFKKTSRFLWIAFCMIISYLISEIIFTATYCRNTFTYPLCFEYSLLSSQTISFDLIFTGRLRYEQVLNINE